MTFLGVICLALGARALFDKDNEVYQTISAVLTIIIGFVLILLGETHLLDSVFFAYRAPCV